MRGRPTEDEYVERSQKQQLRSRATRGLQKEGKKEEVVERENTDHLK